MFERFTSRGRRVPVVATEEARLLRHGSVGSEHLLLAVVRDERGIASELLEARGVTYEAVHREIERAVGVGGHVVGHVPFTPNAKKTLELSLREALQLHHDFIAPEHIALALTRESYTVAAQVLNALDVDTEALRGDLLARADEFRTRAHDDPGPLRSDFPRTVLRGAGSMGGAVPIESHGSPLLRCSLCGRSEHATRRMVVALGIAICAVCVGGLGEVADADGDATVVRFRPTEPAPGDRQGAVDEIERVFAVVFGATRGRVDEQVVAIEDGPRLRDAITEWYRLSKQQRHRAVDVSVVHVRFVDQAEAEVTIGIWMPGVTTGPKLQQVRAVAVDGAWKVSRETAARFAAMVGVRFPPREDH